MLKINLKRERETMKRMKKKERLRDSWRKGKGVLFSRQWQNETWGNEKLDLNMTTNKESMDRERDSASKLLLQSRGL